MPRNVRTQERCRVMRAPPPPGPPAAGWILTSAGHQPLVPLKLPDSHRVYLLPSKPHTGFQGCLLLTLGSGLRGHTFQASLLHSWHSFSPEPVLARNSKATARDGLVRASSETRFSEIWLCIPVSSCLGNKCRGPSHTSQTCPKHQLFTFQSKMIIFFL